MKQVSTGNTKGSWMKGVESFFWTYRSTISRGGVEGMHLFVEPRQCGGPPNHRQWRVSFSFLLKLYSTPWETSLRESFELCRSRKYACDRCLVIHPSPSFVVLCFIGLCPHHLVFVVLSITSGWMVTSVFKRYAEFRNTAAIHYLDN